MIALTMKDSKRRNRTITVLNGFVNAHGSKCAQVQNDSEGRNIYLVRVNVAGVGTCECEGYSKWGRQCYHIKAIAAVKLLTAEELELVAANAELDIVGAALQVANQSHAHAAIGDAYEVLAPTKKVTCPGCGKHDNNYNRYGRCYWLPIGEAL
jgi:hypothetical protein